VGLGAAAAAEKPRLLADRADPTAIVADGRAYLFATGRGVRVWRSADLHEWEGLGRVFDRAVPAWAAEAVPGAKAVWAPDISRHNGQYFLYYSVSTLGSQRSAIGLAVNRALDPGAPGFGWEDRGLVIDSGRGRTDFNAIDPALLVDAEGAWWLFFGSWWTGIKAVRIDPRTGKRLAGSAEIVPIARRGEGEEPSIEAPYVVHRNGWYWLFVSWGTILPPRTCTYRVMVGRARTATGPYRDFSGRRLLDGGGTLVLASHEQWRGPGHNGVVRFRGRDWMVHHTYDLRRISAGRIGQVRPMYWVAGWPVVGEPLDGPAAAEPGRLRRSVVGRWRHSVDYGRPGMLELRGDGRVVTEGGGGTWTVSDDRLTLRFPSAEAPSGAWLDRLMVELDGQSYIGRNQNGQVIRGVRAGAP
jgi:arabinan endo-1,5-alpha-L-arabinosidase